jgi:hypothetical protein
VYLEPGQGSVSLSRPDSGLLSPERASAQEPALAQLYDDPLKEQEWVEATKARLCFGYLDWVLLDLEQMKLRDEKVSEELRKLWGYLKENQVRVMYGRLRRKGYPLESRGIESANKFISHGRLKRSGAWLYVERANEMLALRCAKPGLSPAEGYNGTFEKVFQLYKQREQAQGSQASPSSLRNG